MRVQSAHNVEQGRSVWREQQCVLIVQLTVLQTQITLNVVSYNKYGWNLWNVQIIVHCYYRVQQIITLLLKHIISVSCSGLNPVWMNINTETGFPVATGTTMIVKCNVGYHNEGSESITCDSKTSYNFHTEPRCVGMFKSQF